MKWQFEELVAFLRVMETGTLTAAAAQLNVSKSVISRRIQKLESALKIELFHRSRRLMRPTEVALDLHHQMHPLVVEIQKTVEAATTDKDFLDGHLRVTVPVMLGVMFLSQIVAEFGHLHPRLHLTLDLDNKRIDLTQSSYDVAIRVGMPGDSPLRARKLGTCERVVCCSPAYSKKHGLPASIAELSGHEVIDYTYVQANQLWQFENCTEPDDVTAPSRPRMRSRIASNNGSAIREAAIAGLGLAVLPAYFVASDIREGKLLVVLPHEKLIPAGVYAMYPMTRHVAPKVRAFIDYLVGALPIRLAGLQDAKQTPCQFSSGVFC